ncbi:MAG: NAD(P)-dependent oxidoreductase [Actinomycetota bacterium]
MGVTVLNLLGEPAAAAARTAVPDAEILTCAADAVPADARAEAMFSPFSVMPLHDRLDEIGVRWMHIPGTGVDSWPRAILAGRTVTCSRGISAVPIAEYVLAAILAAEKDIPGVFLDAVPAHWNFHPLGELADKTVALVGLGGIGEAVARRARAFGCRVRALRRRPDQGAPEGVELAADLGDLFASADHLVIAAPATPATEHLLDDDAFALVKPGVHIVNIARGSLVDQDALRRALDDDRVALATLDTVTPEPLPEGHWMFTHPKVRVTAHVSWGSPNAFPRMMQAFADNLARYVAGEPLVGVVDPDEGY